MAASGARILYVDDEPMLLEIFSRWLMGTDRYDVATATDGQQALEMLVSEPFDLLITDVRMPRMDGVSLVRRLADLEKPLPSIIFVTGFGDVDEREMHSLGVEAFLSKPVKRPDLLRAVERAIAHRDLLWQLPMEESPRQSIVIEVEDFSANAREGCIALGRGGFSAPYGQQVSLGKVSFRCHLRARDFTISGEGYVRWRSRDEMTIGIEFAYLDDDCRAATVEQIRAVNPRQFIPAR
jgi:CheY-like chemotaxis protein